MLPISLNREAKVYFAFLGNLGVLVLSFAFSDQEINNAHSRWNGRNPRLSGRRRGC